MARSLFAAVLWVYTGWVTGNAAVMFAGAPELVGPLAGVVGLGLFLALYGFGPAHPSIRRAAQAAADAVADAAADLDLDPGLAR